MRKFNIGLILTIIVIISTVIYNIDLEYKRKSDKIQIQKICIEYINFENKYCMLDQKYRTFPKTISDEEYATYLDTMKKELKIYFIDKDEYISNQYSIIKRRLDKQLSDNGYVITQLNKTTTNISSYLFNENTVKVTIETYVNAQYINNQYNQISDDAKIYNQNTQDIINLEKIDGVWKIIYADLSYVDISNIPIF